ncbi:hypothetical protein JCM16814_10650 [Desulfobaculum senezii]
MRGSTAGVIRFGLVPDASFKAVSQDFAQSASLVSRAHRRVVGKLRSTKAPGGGSAPQVRGVSGGAGSGQASGASAAAPSSAAGAGGSGIGAAGAQATQLGAALGGAWEHAKTLGAALTNSNREMTRLSNQAASLGFSTEGLAAWNGLGAEMGLTSDQIGGVASSLQATMTQLEQGGAAAHGAKESLGALGLSFAELKDMSPEERLQCVAERLRTLGDTQQAVDIGGALMGDSGGELAAGLSERTKSVGELLATQKELNVVSEAGRSGAKNYTAAFGRFSTVVSSVTGELFGVIGGALAPLLNEWGPRLAQWARENRSEFGKIGEAVAQFASGAAKAFSTVVSCVTWAADAVGGFENLAMMLGAVLAGKTVMSVVSFGASLMSIGNVMSGIAGRVFPLLVSGIKAVGIAFAANPIGFVITGITLAVVRLITIWDDLKKAFTEGGFLGAVGRFFSLGGDDDDEEDERVKRAKPVQRAREPRRFAPAARASVPASAPRAVPAVPAVPAAAGAGAAPAQVSQHIDSINIYATPQQSVHDIAEAVLRRLDERSRVARRRALHDG